MQKQYTSQEIEKLVLDYIHKKSVSGYNKDFNPLNLSLEYISSELMLKTEEVDEAIKNLSGMGGLGRSKIRKIESIEPQFTIWLPNTEEGDKIKETLCQKGLAIKGVWKQSFSIIFILLSYICIFNFTNFKTFSQNKNITGMFWVATIITAISIPVAKYLSYRWYQLTAKVKKIKGYNYFIYIIFGIIGLIFISIKQGWGKFWLFFIPCIATLLEIISFVFRLYKKNL